MATPISVQIVNEESGKYLHHFQTGLEIDLASDLDLDITFYIDRTKYPKANAIDILLEQNDYRLVVGLGYDFQWISIIFLCQ